jgi:peptidoglycan/LPS O-acetylase OafA/YrhL
VYDPANVCYWAGRYGELIGHWSAEFLTGFIVSLIISFFSYIFVEKQGMDSRSTFKNKYALNPIEKKTKKDVEDSALVPLIVADLDVSLNSKSSNKAK